MSQLRRLGPGIVAVAIGTVLRLPLALTILTVAFYYLQPYLVRERDERERKELIKRIKEESREPEFNMETKPKETR
jgi:hypothetical protein